MIKGNSISGDKTAQIELWSNIGTFVQRFVSVSRLNARKSGLTLTRAWILQVISQRKEMTATELSNYTGTTPPTITDILESLVKTRCIIKNRNAEDGRKLVVSVSETGSERLRKFLELQQTFVERIEKTADKDFLDKLPEVFRTLVRVTASFSLDDQL